MGKTWEWRVYLDTVPVKTEKWVLGTESYYLEKCFSISDGLGEGGAGATFDQASHSSRHLLQADGGAGSDGAGTSPPPAKEDDDGGFSMSTIIALAASGASGLLSAVNQV